MDADTAAQPFRSVLYIPASKLRALEKARALRADAVIFDLEDAVAPDSKVQARDTLAAALAEGGYGRRARIVRINALDTEWGETDARTFGVSTEAADAILLPKVAAPGDVDALTALIAPDMPVWVMMETPQGILNAAAIAAHPRVTGLVAGTNDLATDLGTRGRADRLPLLMALQAIVLAARAAGGVLAIDGVYNRFKETEGLRAECDQGRDLGFDGKTLIHPAQLEAANTAFAPTGDEIDLARRQIAAHEDCAAAGQGVAVVDGQIVEYLHVTAARRLLARAEAIAAMSAEHTGQETTA